MTRRQLFSLCGKLVGHYPIAGWLRVACSYVKRTAEGSGWEDFVGPTTMQFVKDMCQRMEKEDPVYGRWNVPKTPKGRVWCDASSIALGVVLEVNDNIVEDAAWLRKKDDYSHINVAELEAVLKGVNMAIRWGITEIEILTDSATVSNWIKIIMSEEKRVHTKGAEEMIIKRRLATLKALINEYELSVTVVLVPTTKNKADVLTRVKKDWLTIKQQGVLRKETTGICMAGHVDIKEMHRMHHMGVDRTLYLAKLVDPGVTRDEVKKVVKSCEECQSIDPPPRVHEKGNLSVTENWKRIAIDTTHYHQLPYLSIVDCGPSRFTIWRALTRETAETITAILEQLFLERGPPHELLMDNAQAFHSGLMKEMLQKWGVKSLYRAAYKPSGNGIVERNHRTIKAIAERAGISPEVAVSYYNQTPRSGTNPSSVPYRGIYQYDWRWPIKGSLNDEEVNTSNIVKMGEEVWVKPSNAKCTTRWKKGTVTGINSDNNVIVDNVPRHILDIRDIVTEEAPETGTNETEAPETVTNDDTDEVHEPQVRRYPNRVRRPPVWMRDYETEFSDDSEDEI
jgi:ribonuclease HI